MRSLTDERRRSSVALTFGAAWAASLALPVAYNENGVTHGYDVLLFGWMGAFMFQFGWSANLLLPAAILAILLGAGSGRLWPRIVGWAVLLCGLNSLAWTDIPDDSGPNPIARFGIGYYVWMAAALGGGAWLIALGRSHARPQAAMEAS